MSLFRSAVRLLAAYALKRNEENLNFQALAFRKKTKLHLDSPVNAFWLIAGPIQGL